jgi:capsular exopolysaccharide synthesis family protein
VPDKHAPEKTQHVTMDVSQRPLNAGRDAERDEIELEPVLHAIKIGWKWPVIMGGGLAILTVIVVLMSRPEFMAGGSLYLASVEKNQSLSSEAASSISLLTGLAHGSNMETQVEIISSRDMVKRAILSAGINSEVWRAGQRPALTFAGWKLGGETLSLYDPAPDALRALYGNITDPNLKKKKLTIRFGHGGQYQILHHGLALLTGQLDQPAVGPGLRLILRAVHAHYVPPVHAEYRIRIENAMEAYDTMIKTGAISVTQDGRIGGGGKKTSYLVDIHYKSSDPFAAERFVSELMHTYLSETQSWSTDQAGASYNYLSRQLEKIRTALTTADARLASYQSKSGVIAVSAGAKAMIGQLANYETQRSQAKITLYSLTQIRKALTQPSGALNPYLLSSIQDPVLDKLSGHLVAAQSEVSSLQKLYTSAAPQMIQAQAKLTTIRSAISELVQNQEQMATQQLQSINSIIAQHQTKMATFPHSELEVISLTRSSEVLGKLYMFLLQKQEEAAINKASTLTKNRILDTALVRDRPVAPNAKKDVVLFGLLGVFLGMGIVVGRYLLHPGFRSDEELRRRYPFLPVYGLLPLAHQVFRSKASMFQMPEPRSGYGEALRLLRGNFYLAAGDGGGQVVALTSAIPSDGKSTLAFQLAVALAQDGKKVLLMDADLRNPHAHLAFNVTQEPGLAGVLAGRSTWQEVLHHLQGIGIDLITAGNIPPNPSEHLGSGKMGQLLADLRPHYDYVLMDTPPFPMVGDLLIIGPLADRLLTIAKVEHTPRRAYQEHLQGILSLDRPLGLIINGIRVQGSYGYGYGYGVDVNSESLQPTVSGWRSLLKRLGKKR